jgi:hypothetical protein
MIPGATDTIREHAARALQHIDALTRIYDEVLLPMPMNFSEIDGLPVRLEPMYDCAAVGYDPAGPRLIYSESIILRVIAHAHDINEEAALDLFNTHLAHLADESRGPIFMVPGRLVRG